MEAQTRTLDLRDGKRTTLRFDVPTWRAVETLAEGEGIRWTEWVRRLIAANPDAENMHAVIRAATVEGLLAESVFAQRADQVRSGGAVLLEGCNMLDDAALADQLAHGKVEGGPVDMLGFQLFVGTDSNEQPVIWVKNGLRDGLHLAIAIPFSREEVEAKRGAFA
ncbi:hypothetical protein [Ramlibacter pallidus]|uniref:Ribbon-helix-helix protein CopG domain-containing protein n=1 Tax=Ramlibacter pallidus TaxID=2780087 RepID=A0ABR9S937_9BURK|nr:hypothetical protein [Ramlibacter pallidus]MBE7370035.1 hypothetical protein [Ramlibacter pallidus]